MSCPWEQLHWNNLGSCWVITRWHQWPRTRLPVQKMQEMQVQSLGREGPLEERLATHSRILAWRTPWTEESLVLGVTKESDTTEVT